MKKLLTGILTASIIATMCAVSTFAAPDTPGFYDENDNPLVQGDKPILSNTDPKDVTIPVYGYVGEDAVIVDPDPEDPSEPPVINQFDINVAVPVKILWAAFVSDNGVVTSPEYYIKNLSMSKDLEVTITEFRATNSPGDNDDVDKFLELYLTPLDENSFDGDGTDMGDSIELLIGDGTDVEYRGDGTTSPGLGDAYLVGEELGKVGTITTGAPVSWNFKITGQYDNTKWPASPKEPTYNLVFTFSVV